jgi:acyl carrier protein
MATEDKIRDIIVTSLKFEGTRARLTNDFPLTVCHVIDSLDMLKLVSALEEEFVLEIDDVDLVPDNFGTITFEVVDELRRTPIGKLKRFCSARRALAPT